MSALCSWRNSQQTRPAAFALLDYLSTDEIQVDYVQKGVDLLPLKNGIAPLDDIDPLVAKMVSFLDEGYGVGTQVGIHWREATNSLRARSTCGDERHQDPRASLGRC